MMYFNTFIVQVTLESTYDTVDEACDPITEPFSTTNLEIPELSLPSYLQFIVMPCE